MTSARSRSRLALALLLGALVAALLPGISADARSGDLPIPPTEVNVDLPGNLTPYHEVAPRLNDLAERSNRLQVEVMGQSAGGRDLYLATLTAPPQRGINAQRVLRQRMMRTPVWASENLDRYRDFKVPVWINASIHGNEYEGVDAALATIERLALSDDPEVLELLDTTIVLVNVVQNPDGRVLGTRANANGFDPNRDFATNSQPETAAVRDQLVVWNPMVFLDLHGYVGGYLIEPTTPPHNPNYEYDLYIKHALGNALAMEQSLLDLDATVDDSGLDPVIPFRDWDVGDWDDWPPIFAPMYAMYHGAFGHTLESQWRVNGGAVNLPVDERERRASLNQAAHEAVVWGSLEYVMDNRMEMVQDQLEVFVRGATSAEPFPVEPGFVPGFGPEDQYVADYPGGYVIPRGDTQESASAARMLVDHLVSHGIEVGATRRAETIDGVTHAAGSWVVSMAQPRRGLANTFLETGYDISDRTPQMYDISGWSLSELWGATVVRVDQVPRRTRLIRSAQADPSTVPDGPAAAWSLVLDGIPAIQAVNGLLDDDVDVWRDPDGSILVDAGAGPDLDALVASGVRLEAVAEVPDDAEALDAVRLGTSVASDERFVLDRLGFDLAPVTNGGLSDATVDLDELDAIVVSGSLDASSWSADGQAAFADWLADGGAVVGLTTGGANFNASADLLDVSFTRGPACSTANGVVQVDVDELGPTTPGMTPDDSSFVYGPVWFTDTDDVTVDQRYDADDVLIAGHWLGDDEDGANTCRFPRTDNGQDDAAGHAGVVSGTDESGARVVLFGTDPMFRDHPRGLFTQVVNALYWGTAD